MAYTSVSTALNQNESVKAKAKLPTKPLPKMAIPLLFEISLSFTTSFLSSNVMDQNINNMAKALATPLIKFITNPIFEVSPKAKEEKKAPSIWNNGAPGGCPT